MDISLLIATRSPRQKLEDLFANMKATARDISRVEVLIKIDRDDPELLSYYKSNEWRKWNMNIHFVITDRNGGYFNLGPAYNNLLLAADPSSYFLCVGNDDLRFALPAWDDKIMSFRGHWPDDIVYLRTSLHKHVTYNENNIMQMIAQPDNFSFYSRRLIHFMEGCGDYWSTDSWFGGIVGLLEYRYKHARGIIIHEELFHANSMMWSNKSAQECNKIMQAFHRMASAPYVEYSFDRIARKIADYINSRKS